MAQPAENLKILLLFDFPFAPPRDADYARAMDPGDWKPISRALQTLRRLGHYVEPLALYHDLKPLLIRLLEDPPDLVFVMADSFLNDRSFEPALVRLLEKAGVAHSGCPSAALKICGDKARVTRLLREVGLRTPKGRLVRKGAKALVAGLRLPVIVKPLHEEGSEGISALSYCSTPGQMRARIGACHRKYGDAFVEEYIEGREIYAGMIGGGKPRMLALRELVFGDWPAGLPRFAHFRAKWDPKFRRRFGLKSVNHPRLEPAVERAIRRCCEAAWKRLGLSGCARLDLRVKESGEVYVIEANPNPSLAPDDELAGAAKGIGLSYSALLKSLVTIGARKGGRG